MPRTPLKLRAPTAQLHGICCLGQGQGPHHGPGGSSHPRVFSWPRTPKAQSKPRSLVSIEFCNKPPNRCFLPRFLADGAAGLHCHLVTV